MPRRLAARTPARASGELHPCIWPRCDRLIPAGLVACKADWQRIPHYLRHELKAAQEPGQTPLTATGEYKRVLARVTRWAQREAAMETVR